MQSVSHKRLFTGSFPYSTSRFYASWETAWTNRHRQFFGERKWIEANSRKKISKHIKPTAPAKPVSMPKLSSWLPPKLKSHKIGSSIKETVVDPKTTSKTNLDVQEHDANVRNTFKKLRDASTLEQIKEAILPLEANILKFYEDARDTNPTMGNLSGMRTSNTQESLPTHLKPEFSVKQVAGDGNCLYSSISTALFGNVNSQNMFRLSQVHHMVQNEEKLKSISQVAFQKQFEDILNDTKTLPTNCQEGWGDEANLIFLSTILERSVIVHSASVTNKDGLQQMYLSNKDHLSRTPIFISHDQIGQHFEPMIPQVKSISSIVPTLMSRTHERLDPDYSWQPFKPLNKAYEDEFNVEMLSERNSNATDMTSSDDAEMRSKTDSSGSGDDAIKTKHNEIAATNEPLNVKMINEKLNEIMTALADMTNKLSLVQYKPVTAVPPKEAPVVAIDTKMQNCKSVEDILREFPVFKTRLTDSAGEADFYDEIYCDLCTDDLSKNKKTGTFSYHSSDQLDSQPQTGAFRNLKKHLRSHLSSANHCKMAKEDSIRKTQNATLAEKNRVAGLTLGKFAYTAIKSDHNLSKYEEYVAIASSLPDKLTIGDINHSNEFPSNFSSSLFECLHKQMKTSLHTPLKSTGKPPPFSIIADKYTPKRVAGQIVGIQTLIDGNMQDLNIDYPEVTQFKGSDVGKLLYSSLRTIASDEHIRTRLVGGAFDGEYFIKKIPDALIGRECLDVKAEAKEWYSWVWDPAHILELAAEKANLAAKDLEKIDKVVKNINKSFRVGKQYVALRDAAVETEQKLYEPIQGSETRWLAHHHRVANNFMQNYSTFYKVLNDEQKDELNDINSVGFVIGLCAKADMYKQLAVLSKKFQRVGEYPWALEDYTNEAFQTIQDMISSLPDKGTDLSTIHDAFASLKEAAPGVTDSNPTYKGRPIYFSPQFTTGTKSKRKETAVCSAEPILQKVKQQLQLFLNKVKDNHHERTEKYPNLILQHASDCFKLENVLKSNQTADIPPALFTYVDLAKKSGYLAEDSPPYEEIEEQYKEFSDVVTDMYESMVKIRPSLADAPRETERRIYENIINAHTHRKISEISDLLLSSMMRSSNESVCESMGSYVKNISTDRPLKQQNLKQEVFISYNGPAPFSKDVDALVTDALNKHFNTKNHRDWHFHRTSRPTILRHFSVSAVVDRKIKAAEESKKLKYLRDIDGKTDGTQNYNNSQS